MNKLQTLKTIQKWLETVDPHVWESTPNNEFDTPGVAEGYGYDGRYHTIYSTQEVYDQFVRDMTDLCRPDLQSHEQRDINPDAYDASFLTKIQFTHYLSMCGYITTVRKRKGKSVRCFANLTQK